MAADTQRQPSSARCDVFIVRPGPSVVEGVEALPSILHSDVRGHVDPVNARRIR